MSKQWAVLFDSNGLDGLISCDEMRTEEMLKWIGGAKFDSKLSTYVTMMILRAQANPQRFPEVWVYNTEEDFTEEDMRKLWDDMPQRMADLVRSKGTSLYRFRKEKSVIV